MIEQQINRICNKKQVLCANQGRANSQWDNEQFDQWMTRQLNCLVGQWIEFATPNSVTNWKSVVVRRTHSTYST